MIQKSEFDKELEEFESRLERLRALYEQYFLGMERIPPHVARKDVDRRAWRLKRVKLRNTAKRFKLNTLMQRYNTLQQYWMKVCRQIENGSYTRHLQRAERRFGAAARRRRANSVPAEAAEKTRDALDETAGDLSRLLAEEPSALDELAAEVSAAPSRPRPPRPSNPPARASNPITDPPRHSLRSPARRSLPPPKPGSRPAPPRRPSSNRVAETPMAAQSSTQSSARRRSSPPAKPSQGAARARGTVAAAADGRLRPSKTNQTADPKAQQARRRPKGNAKLSDDRVSQLYGSLMDERKKLKQSGGLNEKALAQSLRTTEAKLRKKYAGKKIDFKVAVKDGKAVIKPVVG